MYNPVTGSGKLILVLGFITAITEKVIFRHEAEPCTRSYRAGIKKRNAHSARNSTKEQDRKAGLPVIDPAYIIER